MTKLWIVLLIVAGIAAIYFATRKYPVLDADGVESPYRKGGPFDRSIYFSKYIGDGLKGSTHHIRIPDADKESFEIVTITLENPGGEAQILQVGKSQDRYFVGDLPLPFNPKEERLVKANRDRNRGPVLYITEKRVFLLDQDSMIEVPGVDPGTFWLADEPQSSHGVSYCKDRNRVMYFKQDFESGPRFVVVEGADPKTFQQVKTDYGKDKSNSYFKEKIDSAGPIVKIDNVYSKNSNKVFYYEMPVNGVDAKSFQVIGNGFSRDKSQVFYSDTPIPGIDPNTFRFLSNIEAKKTRGAFVDIDYVADKSNIYFNTRINTAFQKVERADVGSFQELNFSFGADRSHVFYEGKMLKDIDRDGFEVLYEEFPMGFYVKNDRHVYIVDEDRKLKIVEKADPKNFVAYKANSVIHGKRDAEDSRHYFLNGKATGSK